MNESNNVLALLEEAGGKLVAEDDLVWSDDRTLQIPKSMSLGEAIRFLRRKQQEDEEPTGFSRAYRFRPWDGAMATYRALKRVFGMVALSGQGWSAPSMVTINVGVNQTEQVPWGTLTIPVLPDVTFGLDTTHDPEYGLLFQLSAYGPRKHRHAINGVFNIVEDELQRESIYRGKAFDGQDRPEFIDPFAVDRRQIVYTQETGEQIEANVWALLRYTDAHRALGLPLKRTILFEGPYGTGKTVGATITAQEAIANGWTFVYCRPGRDDLSTCMATARLYQPSVLFVEDVDTISDPETTDADGVTRLLDLFDGITSKQTEMLVVMTTNHPEKIHKGMIRPGRIHSVIHIGELDADGIQRMVRVLVPSENLSPDIDFDSVSEAMVGFLPAYVRESVDRAQRYNLSRNGGFLTSIGTADLVSAANGLRPQLDLMNGAKEAKTVDPLSEAFASVVGNTVSADIASVNESVTESVVSIVNKVPRQIVSRLDGMAIIDDDGDVMYRIDTSQ